MSASRSVTLTHNERSVTVFSRTFAGAGGSIVNHHHLTRTIDQPAPQHTDR
jgi:hypothetical protein